MAFLHDPTFWVAIGFFAFIALVFRPAARMVTSALDERAGKIKEDLDGAEKLLEEAQDLLANYQRKQREAAKEAGAIVSHAREESERLAQHARERMEASLERRRQLALERIAQAEQAALNRVRNETVELAIAATRGYLAENISAKKADALVDGAIKDLPQNLQ